MISKTGIWNVGTRPVTSLKCPKGMQSNLFGLHNMDDGWQRIVDPKVEGRVKVEGRYYCFFLRRRRKESAQCKTPSLG